MEHFIPFSVYLLQKRNNYKCCSRRVKLAGQWSCLLQPKEKNNMFELVTNTVDNIQLKNYTAHREPNNNSNNYKNVSMSKHTAQVQQHWAG